MHDADLESRLSTAVDDLRPSTELGARVAIRVAQYDRRRRAARLGVSVVAGLVVVALIGTALAINGGRSHHVIADQPHSTFRWSTLPAPPIPARQRAAAVWTGTEAIFWGGEQPTPGAVTCTGKGEARKCTVRETIAAGTEAGITRPVLGDGAAYDPTKGTWRVVPNAPIGPRSRAAAVWTGTEMIVWGGWRPKATGTESLAWSDGAAYNPVTNLWRVIPDAPISRIAADAIWTGREMVVLGGSIVGAPGADQVFGAAFDPVKNTWRTIPAPQAPTPSFGHASWTGEEILYWLPSGDSTIKTLTTPPALFSYNPSTDQWRRLASPAPQFKLVWDQAFVGVGGGRLILAGLVPQGRLWDAEAIGYDPGSDSWAKIIRGKNTEGRLVGIGGVGTVGTGRQLLLFTAFDASSLDPAVGTWRPLPAAPFKIDQAAAASTDDGRVFIWGANGAAALSAG